MTSTVQDHPDSVPRSRDPQSSDPGHLSPRQEREVTRVLVDARHTGPMPDEVVARLDGVLASLADERSAPAAAVVDLAARRRTRRLRLLVAAAAVVAAGVALPSYLPQLSGGGEDQSSSDSAGSTASEERAPHATGPEEGAGWGSSGAEDLDGALAHAVPVRIRSEHFAADVVRATRDRAALQSDGHASARESLSALPDLSVAQARCVPDDVSGRVYSASYDGRRGVLVVGPRVDGERRYDLFVCGKPQITRSVVLPAG